MANDIKMIWDNTFLEGDFELGLGDLTRDDGLETAVLISLFSDRRAEDDDEIDDINDRRGWWGDNVSLTPVGSKLWQLDRSKTTQKTVVLTKQYIEDCLEWMIDDDVAEKIEVNVERQGNPGQDRLSVEIKIYQVDKNIKALRFDDLWKMELLS
jgi:phage gp46-like protein